MVYLKNQFNDIVVDFIFEEIIRFSNMEVTGVVIGLAGFMQGEAVAAASYAHAETFKGFGNFMMILGLIERVALYVMIFVIVTLNKLSYG